MLFLLVLLITILMRIIVERFGMVSFMVFLRRGVGAESESEVGVGVEVEVEVEE